MIKSAPFTWILFAISILFFLIMPYWLVQFLCIGIITVILLSFLYARNLSKNLKVERKLKKLKVNCHEQINITLSVKNFSHLPAFFCYVLDQAPYFYVYNDKNQELFTLRPKEVRQISYRISAQERGLFMIGPVKLHAHDPMGLFELEMEIDQPLEVTVRPGHIKLRTELLPGLPQGLLKTKNPVYEDITMRRSIREYMAGDEQKRINWRASAKYQHLYTNQYEASYNVPVFIFLNLAEDDYEMHERAYYSEKAIEIAANIVERARELKQDCGFAAYGSGFPFLPPKQNQWDYILDLLSLIKIEAGKVDYNPVQKFKSRLPSACLFYSIGPDEVMHYFAKVEAGNENINTTNLGVLKNAGKQ